MKRSSERNKETQREERRRERKEREREKTRERQDIHTGIIMHTVVHYDRTSAYLGTPPHFAKTHSWASV